VAAASPDCVGVAGIDGYQMVRRIEIQLTQADGSIHPYSLRPSISEMLIRVTRTDGQVCNIDRTTANTYGRRFG
jgi:hypothetical protein